MALAIGYTGIDPATAEQIKQQREYAKALREKPGGDPRSPFYTPVNVAADIINGLMGKHQMDEANQLEKGYNRAAEARINESGIGGPGAAAPFSQPNPRLAVLSSPDQSSPSLPQPQPGISQPPTTPPSDLAEVPSSIGGRGSTIGMGPRVAQASPNDPSAAYTRLLGALVGQGMPVHDALAITESALKGRVGYGPQYQVDPYGRYELHRPNMPPVYQGQMPGHPGKVEPLSPDIPGARLQERIGPDGNLRPPRITVPEVAPGPRSEIDAPGVSPTGATAETAPTAPTTPPRGLLGRTPPSELPPWQVAMEGDLKNTPLPTKVAQADTKTEAVSPGTGLDAKYPMEKTAKEYLDAAFKDQPKDLEMPPIVGRAFEKAKRGGPEALDALANIKPNREAAKKIIEDTQIEQNKIYAKKQEAITSAGDQAIKLRQSLKTAKKALESPDFQSGPMNRIVELGQGLREELGNTAKDIANDTTYPESIRNAAKKTAEWALDPNNHTATANQIYTKLISGSILQSLRGMLGENSGQFRQFEFQLLEKSFGNTAMTLEANKAVMNMIDKLNDRNILITKMADEYASQRGKLDPKFNQYMLKFQEEHPAYDPDEFNRALKLATEGEQPKGGASGSSSKPEPTPQKYDPKKGWKTPF